MGLELFGFNKSFIESQNFSGSEASNLTCYWLENRW